MLYVTVIYDIHLVTVFCYLPCWLRWFGCCCCCLVVVGVTVVRLLVVVGCCTVVYVVPVVDSWFGCVVVTLRLLLLFWTWLLLVVVVVDIWLTCCFVTFGRFDWLRLNVPHVFYVVVFTRLHVVYGCCG